MRKGNQIGMNQLIALFYFVAMTTLFYLIFLSSSNPIEEKQENSSLFVLYSSLYQEVSILVNQSRNTILHSLEVWIFVTKANLII
mgnify:FL=1|jgi:hypothetical protein